MSDTELVPFPGDILSDDSSYYGDDETKKEYDDDLQAFNPLEFWEAHAVNYGCLLAQAKASPRPILGRKHALEDSSVGSEPKRAKFEINNDEDTKDTRGVATDSTAHVPRPTNTNSKEKEEYFNNPHEGNMNAKQTDETIDDFIKRLRPSTSTSMDIQGSWIWCANPHHECEFQKTGEFKQTGFKLLEEFTRQRQRVEDENPGKAPGAITRMLAGQRQFLEHQITELAKSCQVLTGKWMLFPTAEDVDEVWRTVAQATWDGTLGCDAKVAPLDPSDAKPERLICIYTRDFTDLDDVKYVLKEMKRLGLVRDHGGAKVIYYKCDAYTHLDLMNGNEYKIRASLYNSRDLFKEMGGSRKKKA